MYPLLYVFPSSVILLEVLLLLRFAKHRLWIRYPHLTFFVVFDLAGNAILFLIHSRRPELFPEAYWRIASISLFLRFLVNWEFFRGVFPGRSMLYDTAWKVVVAVELSTFPVLLLVGWNQASSIPYRYLHFPPIVEQYFSLAQALLLLTPATLALYYRIPLGRNLRGLCLGFGVYLLVRSMNSATLQILQGFAPYWRLLTPATFVTMIAIWVWAFWDYAPSPEQTALESRTVALLRRGAS